MWEAVIKFIKYILVSITIVKNAVLANNYRIIFKEAYLLAMLIYPLYEFLSL